MVGNFIALTYVYLNWWYRPICTGLTLLNEMHNVFPSFEFLNLSFLVHISTSITSIVLQFRYIKSIK